MKKYLIYVDDCSTIFKVAVVAKNENEAKKQFEGSGEIVAVKDITDNWEVSLSHLEDMFCASTCHYGNVERQLILSVLRNSGVFTD